MSKHNTNCSQPKRSHRHTEVTVFNEGAKQGDKAE